MFTDRVDAGRRLAAKLQHLRGACVVVGLPRGGVPVAAEVARSLEAPLDVILVRKLGVPHHPELAMGAIGEDGVRVVNEEIVRQAQVDAEAFDRVERRERIELERRAQQYRGVRQRLALDGQTVVVVDDGIATGSTARAACAVARRYGARRVVLAAPVGPASVAHDLGGAADEVVFVQTPSEMSSVGSWYRDFAATSDEEVLRLITVGGVPRGTRAAAHVHMDGDGIDDHSQG